MVKLHKPDVYEDLVLGVESIPAQVDDLDSPCLDPLETIRREAEAFDFYLKDFWDRVQPKDENDFIDHVEAAMVQNGVPGRTKVDHRFTKGICMRSCSVPRGTLFTTKIHGTQHPLAIMQGQLSIWTRENGVSSYSAPNILITEPGTRRIVFTHSDVVGVTFHPTDETDLQKIEDTIIMKHSNRLLGVAQP
jgi:hypothetical protein